MAAQSRHFNGGVGGTMELDPVFLSRLQFAFVISFHIIFPSFTIGLATWLAAIEGMRLATGRPVYRRVFDFWLKIFALTFAMGVVSGIVMAFQFGTNWSVLAERAGSIQGPLLGYEGFTAFLLEATFFGVMLFGRERAPPWFYFMSCCMVSLGTMLSSFWILCNNSWMQVPIGHVIIDGKIVPDSWRAITTGPIVAVRWPHMLFAAFLTTGMSVAGTGAWHLLHGRHKPESRVMLRWALVLVAALIPLQILFGHLAGDYVLQYQPAKFAAIEARWQTQQPASEVLIAIPDPWAQRNLYALEVPKLGSFIASGSWDARELGLDAFPPEDRPPVVVPFFTFRIMVGMSLIMLAVSWLGVLLLWRGWLERARWFLWSAFLAFPSGFIAVLCGWYTAEVGRQPWVIYGLLRTEDAITPSLTGGQVLLSLIGYVAVYVVIYAFGLSYIYRLLREGPASEPASLGTVTPGRPLAVAVPGSEP
jgi:cytochrome d ubiquinol oxidase subunit I